MMVMNFETKIEIFKRLVYINCELVI